MKLVARKETHSVLTGIDDLLEDVRFTSAKQAFENLFPFDENDETGFQHRFHCEYPGPNPEFDDVILDELPESLEYCEYCWAPSLLENVPGIRWQSLLFEQEPDQPLCNKPFLGIYDDDVEFVYEFDELQELVTAAVSKNDIDALEYMLELQGLDATVETGYGVDSVRLRDRTLTLDALGIDWRAITGEE